MLVPLVRAAAAIASLSAITFSPAGSIEDTLKDPLGDALKQYRDNPGDDKGLQAYKDVWNQVQKEVGFLI